MVHIPPCKWAQRKDRIYLTVIVADAKDTKISFDEKKVNFAGHGTSGSGEGDFAHSFNLFKEINAQESSYKLLVREIQLNLKKKEDGFWDRLTEEPTKQSKQFLSCDWDRWVDEDDEAENDMDFGYGNMDNMDFGGDSDDDDDDVPLDDLDGPPDSNPGSAAPESSEPASSETATEST
eukprot:NODE_3579_length_757_cov_66.579096_g2999_i0.p1 GENE.NODE_3579_length_757_cov_66.579096_g2999_i0~~NODE_3579_length_757_cov_66.579096_g2999_i0.p1  ORF type:complete len:178 (-),score=38.78 NODE_3579_length_757_cov_66.579096_g2999_i0:183-716(-)